MQQQAEIKTFAGLYLQANSFQVPDGAMEVAENVVISKDQKISKVRGYYQYANPGGVPNNLFLYQNRLCKVDANSMAHYADTGTAPNETGNATTNSGVAFTITSPRVSRGMEASNNLYFTTDNGVYKLEAYNSTVFKAGIPPGLDLTANVLLANGPIRSNNQVGYRVVFGRRDANSNLLLGSPSDIVTIGNAPNEAMTYTSSGAGPYTVTVTSTAHGLSTGMIITVSGATNPNADGTYTITVTTPNAFTYSTSANPASGTLDYGATRAIRLEMSIPSEITVSTDGYFFQVYRTTQSGDVDVVPFADFKLIDERIITSAEITSNVAFYEDYIDDVLLGAELYTNPNSREGELQANARAPLCADITLYKNMAVYGNCITRHFVDFGVVDTDELADNDFVEVKIDAVTRRYVARSGVGNETVYATASGTGTITITYTAHNLANGYQVYISGVTGSLPEGIYTISGVTANTFDVTSVGNSATALYFQGLTNGTYYIFKFDETSASVSVQLRETAKSLVKAINSDDSSLVYARYASALTDIPGKVRLEAKGFTDQIFLRAVTATSTTPGQAFNPVFPDSFSTGNQVKSDNDEQPNVFYVSKLGEPEAVPIVNSVTVGSRNKAILRVMALRDSMLVLKEDGVFRVTGDFPQGLSVAPLDNTVFCVAANSADLINNQVAFLSNQGICLATESSVQIVSRKIEDVIQPILGRDNLSLNTFGKSYESERLYMLSTFGPNSTTNDTVYLFNVLNDSWTTSTQTFKGAVLDSKDRMHLITTSNTIARERKTQTRIDFCAQNYAITVVSVAVDTLSAVVTISGHVPVRGDVIVKNDVFYRIESVAAAGSNYDITFIRATNLAAADSLQLYAFITSTIKLAPFHAGMVGKSKQFAQMQIHLRSNAITRCVISFSGMTFGSSESIEWENETAALGWGLEPWGLFPWGQSDEVNLALSTRPAPVIRVYVPRFQQRTTFIQPVIEHSEAGEDLAIQAINFTVRPYTGGERTTI